jgi:hypothetical protein
MIVASIALVAAATALGLAIRYGGQWQAELVGSTGASIGLPPSAPDGPTAAPLSAQRSSDDPNEVLPSFDIARIEPSGDAVIAGRAAPGANVELLRDGEVHDRALADRFGQFVIVPPRLPAGDYKLTLRATPSDGPQSQSKQSVAVTLGPNSKDLPSR